MKWVFLVLSLLTLINGDFSAHVGYLCIGFIFHFSEEIIKEIRECKK